VTDTGSGLTSEECERLFTPYYTTKQHGTGLGLAIVQSVVSDHGGKISVASTKEKGTTFRMELPCDFSAHSAARQGARSAVDLGWISLEVNESGAKSAPTDRR
jgi:nitrogen-specific signal transduction histidine kinase